MRDFTHLNTRYKFAGIFEHAIARNSHAQGSKLGCFALRCTAKCNFLALSNETFTARFLNRDSYRVAEMSERLRTISRSAKNWRNPEE